MMKHEENGTPSDNWRELAERLASAMVVEKARSVDAPGASGTAAVLENTLRAVAAPASTAGLTGTGGTSETSALGSVVQSLAAVTKQLGGPLGWMASLNPILGLMRLFGGSRNQEPVELPRYDRPARQSFLAGISSESDWTMQDVDYGEGWRHRTAGPERESGPQITVQVQAMDSRSFLDHRDEIAAAVRQALLESHSLGDVLSDG
jgi:hypothetical protein